MKRICFLMSLLAVSLMMEAQQPLSFNNSDFTQKLDSVVGSKDFDWTRFKDVFTYYVDDSVIMAETYRWEGSAWTLSGGNTYQFNTGFKQLLGETVLVPEEDHLIPISLIEYTYDDLNRLTLVMNSNVGDTSWVEASKYDYRYSEEGLLDTCVYSTIRNGNWRESELSIYSYNDDQQCIGLRVQRKGGWGPSANQWRDAYRYVFEYENGELARELYYTPVGWFSSEMALDSKLEYEFDANGNLLRKTASITNDSKEWIVRDVYENQFDLGTPASEVLGLEPYWNSICASGMGFASGAPMPLKNLWKSCSIVSTDLDMEFTLYCSGFEGVVEEQVMPLKAYCNGNGLVVENTEPATVMVFDVLGRKVAQEAQALKCEFNLTPGLYIVSNGNVKMKVIVK